MVNEAAFRSLAQSSHRSNASESSLLGTFMSRYDYVELIQCSSFQDGATVHITDGACPTRTLELCGKETAAGLLLALAEDASITPDHSLAVTYRERGEPKAEGLDCLMPWDKYPIFAYWVEGMERERDRKNSEWCIRLAL
jgi:hypothetical protein